MLDHAVVGALHDAQAQVARMAQGKNPVALGHGSTSGGEKHGRMGVGCLEHGEVVHHIDREHMQLERVVAPGRARDVALRLVHQPGNDVVVGDDAAGWRGEEAGTDGAQREGTGLADLDAHDGRRQAPEGLGHLAARRGGDRIGLGTSNAGDEQARGQHRVRNERVVGSGRTS